MNKLRYIALICCFIISCSPKHNAEYYFNEGVRLYDNEQYEEAIECYNKSITLAPDNGAGYINRGLARFSLGLTEDAFTDYKKAYELDTIDRIANFLIAVTLSEVYEENQEAITYFDRVIRHYPDYYSAYYGGGVSRYETGDYQGALEQFAKYLSYTENSWVYYYIGMCNKELGNAKATKEAFEIAVELENPKAGEELEKIILVK